MPDQIRLLIACLLVPAAIALSFALAKAGEPSSLWLWRDALGAM